MTNAHNLIMNTVQVFENKSQKYSEESNKDMINRKIIFWIKYDKGWKERKARTAYKSEVWYDNLWTKTIFEKNMALNTEII